MKRILVLTMVIVAIGMNVRARTYTTSFPLTESPISESGNWINGATTGIDWGDISTTPGKTHDHSGPAQYADATALLTGMWGSDQTVEGTVYVNNIANSPEVELRLRSTLSAHVCSGYEISFSAATSRTPYLIIVRWNGPRGDFTWVANLIDAKYKVKTGDVVKASIVGNTITVYLNGQLMATATDSKYTSGNPGMGFNEQANGDYGYTQFTATDGTTRIERTVKMAPRPAAAQSSGSQILVKVGGSLLPGVVYGCHAPSCTIDGRQLRPSTKLFGVSILKPDALVAPRFPSEK